MKQLVLSAESFSYEFKKGEVKRREQALVKRIGELTNQIMACKRAADMDEALELEELQTDLRAQLAEVQKLLRATQQVDQAMLYQQFFTRHAKESPGKP